MANSLKRTRLPTKQSIQQMTEDHVAELARVRELVMKHGSEEDKLALAGLETLFAISLRLFAQTNFSKLRDIFMTVEIAARMAGKEVVG